MAQLPGRVTDVHRVNSPRLEDPLATADSWSVKTITRGRHRPRVNRSRHRHLAHLSLELRQKQRVFNHLHCERWRRVIVDANFFAAMIVTSTAFSIDQPLGSFAARDQGWAAWTLFDQLPILLPRTPNHPSRLDSTERKCLSLVQLPLSHTLGWHLSVNDTRWSKGFLLPSGCGTQARQPYWLV